MKTTILLAMLLTLTIGAISRADDKADSLAIVVNPKSALDEVTSADLAKIFLARKSKGPDGVKFIILMREPGSAERNAALKLIYNMTDSDYQKYFLQATFTGAVASAPKQLSSADAVKQFVANNPGAIGYVRAADVDGTVKALKVDGKLPGDADYKLKMD